MNNKHLKLILLAVGAFAVLQPQANAQLTVPLGTASSFAILAGSGITFTGAINSNSLGGDILTYPTTTITALEKAFFTAGSNREGDLNSGGIKADLLTAYGVAAGRSPTVSYTGTQELNGSTLVGGVYWDNIDFQNSGTLTLDGGGLPNSVSNSVWIFQSQRLLTASASQILLTNGAQAGNVFWQLGAASTTATLGSGSTFVGTILANNSITVNSGSTVYGRLLSNNGLVTMDTSTISAIPEPATTAILFAGFVGLVVGARRIRRNYSARKQLS